MQAKRGMTLIDVLVGTALVVIIFLALFGLLRASIAISTLVKNETAAMAIANSQMEYIRSLPYTSVGTIGGIPAGLIPQNSTTTEDGIPYAVRTFVQYVDDPADGVGSSDTNGITTDYKNIKVTVYYQGAGQQRQLVLVSNYAPLNIETTTGGGTLQILVVDASGTPIPGATVQIVDASTTSPVNVTTFTDSSGAVLLGGAATSTQYQVTVTKSGYSTAQTYQRTTTNQNPTPGYLTVSVNRTTTATFAIDLLGTLNIHTYSPPASGSFSDTFVDGSKIATSSNVTASGGKLMLTTSSIPGTAISTTTTPASLGSWGVASSTFVTPGNSAATVHVVDATGTLLPDTVLAGNSTGFSTFPVDLSGVSTSTYPALALSANLQTSSTTSIPYVTGWSITYLQNKVPLPNVPFSLTGAKTTGSTGGGAPIYKTTVTSTTTAAGVSNLSLEWDSYALTLPGYDIQDACTAPPFALSPGSTLNESLTLTTHTSNMLLVTVTDSGGTIVPGATVVLSRPGFTKTVTTSSCGAAYFGGLTSATNYSITISKAGYTTSTVNNVTVSGQTLYSDSF